MNSTLKDTLLQKGYKIFVRPFELNIVGIRANSVLPNRFDDSIHVFFHNSEGKLVEQRFAATTDPGTYWLQNPMNPQGTAILKEGQYLNAYMIGLHRGKYMALIQRLPVTVMRDYDRNAVLDFMNGREDKGMFGINIHRAAENGTTKTVDQYSAGCQVFAAAADFNQFMSLCERHRQLYGNQFTYTLLDERAVSRATKKKE
jgi:hypothetical protein